MCRRWGWILLLPLLGLAPAAAQDRFADVEVEVVPVRGGIHMLRARGGNIAVSIGEDGPLVIDDQYAPLTERVLAAIRGLTDHPVRFVVNTHWHMDHTGGNENMGKAGAVLVAHDNVRRRMSEEIHDLFHDFTIEPSPDAALPAVTFADGLTFHWNGETIRVVHLPAAHTDGDALVFFEKANVVHMGDTLWNPYYPYIDYTVGGSLAGMVLALDLALEQIDAQTVLIPGHGELADRDDLVAFRKMLDTVGGRVRALVREGKSLEEIQAAKPTAEFDAVFAPERAFLKPDRWVELVVELVQREPSP